MNKTVPELLDIKNKWWGEIVKLTPNSVATNMMRPGGLGAGQQAASFQQQARATTTTTSTAQYHHQQHQQQPAPVVAGTPNVDMSHLTEEERLMIQSVMAKAEMADMGIPVDTSIPSSTNLPSNTSQALAQQTKQHLQQQQQLMQNKQPPIQPRQSVPQTQVPQASHTSDPQANHPNPSGNMFNNLIGIDSKNQMQVCEQRYQPQPQQQQQMPTNNQQLNMFGHNQNPNVSLNHAPNQNQQQNSVNQNLQFYDQQPFGVEPQQQQQNLSHQQELINQQMFPDNLPQQAVIQQQQPSLNVFEQASLTQNPQNGSLPQQLVVRQQLTDKQFQQQQQQPQRQPISAQQMLQNPQQGIQPAQVSSYSQIDSQINNQSTSNSQYVTNNSGNQMLMNEQQRQQQAHFINNQIVNNQLEQLMGQNQHQQLNAENNNLLQRQQIAQQNQLNIVQQNYNNQALQQAFVQPTPQQQEHPIHLAQLNNMTSFEMSLLDRSSSTQNAQQLVPVLSPRILPREQLSHVSQIKKRQHFPISDAPIEDLAEYSLHSSSSPANSLHRHAKSRQLPQPGKHERSLESPEDKHSNSGQEEEEFPREKKKDKSTTKKSPLPPDKGDEAVRLMKELDLTKQANQVMEQQQLLIKQSQELIKLQLEQQALSQELKKSIEKSSSPSTVVTKTNEEQNQESPKDKEVDEKARLKTSEEIDDRSHTDTANTSDKLSPTQGDSKHKQKLNQNSTKPKGVVKRCSSPQRVKSPDRKTFDTEEELREERAIKYSNHDLIQSPTDTTDSEIEPQSKSNIRRMRSMSQSKPRNVVRRREPTGLPPSPLPVSAAIQLHQMQQQHAKRQIVSGNRPALSRANFMRSRSVTSSPNHHLEHGNSGYLTDNQRIRSTSPDTLSEFGGQRRRKRLPEPPSNAVPLTPSMVRKMIQAQRTGTVSGKLLTSVDAQSNSLTNTHSNRTLAFDRTPSENHAFVKTTQSGTVYNVTSQAHVNNTGATISTSLPVNAQSTTTSSYLNKFLSSTYGNSILKSNITDIKETPELDKLISNLDDYYGLDSKKSLSSTQPSSVTFNMPSEQVSRGDYANDSTTYTPRYVGQSTYSDPTRGISGGVSSNSAFMRRSSEGESNLSSRFSRRPYWQTSKDEQGQLARSTHYPIYHSDTTYVTSLPTAQYRFSSVSNARPIEHQTSFREYTPFSTGMERSAVNYDTKYNSPPIRSSNITRNLGYDSSTNTLDSRPYKSYQGESFGLGYRYNAYNSPSLNTRDRYRHPSQQPDTTTYNPTRSYGLSYQSGLESTRYTKPIRPTLSELISSPYRHRSLDIDSRNEYSDMRPETLISDFRESRYGTQHNQNSETRGYDHRTIGAASTQSASFARNYPGHISSGVKSYNNFTPITKDDIINNGPKFNSIGYRFRTENQNKYVPNASTPTQSLPFRYPYPYKRLLLSKNPKDRIGNGIGVRIIGGKSMPNLYDKVNRCIVTSGAFVTEVFQDSNVYHMGELHTGDQIIEWNGVNLCNRSNDEVQQILLSQFSDDEVEIVYLHRDKFHEGYESMSSLEARNRLAETVPDQFDTFAGYNKSGQRTDESKVRYPADLVKDSSLRRRLSFSSISNMWSK